NEYRLNFKISTVVDDSKYGGGSHRLVSVSMWKSNGRLNVELAEGKKSFLVSDPNDNNAFFEVCRGIKELVVSGVTDSRLD
ncbi:hypothetical protein Q6303_27925, partial [Klebsiella variicola]|nr:hypothetical protein [Klebsiella variicola]